MLMLALLLLAVTAPADADDPTIRRIPRLNPEAPTTAFLNGLWYESDATGIRFTPGERFSVAGVFTAQRPETIDRTIDLGGRVVVPPFGEAHNHSVDGAWTLPTAERYLRQGIFYYKNPNDIATSTASGRPSFNKPDGLDVVWSHGGLSIAGGHPEGLYRGLASNLGLDPDKLDGKAFFDVPTPASVTKRWPEILSGRPDFIKLYLLDAAGQGRGKPSGLSPAAFRRAVIYWRASLGSPPPSTSRHRPTLNWPRTRARMRRPIYPVTVGRTVSTPRPIVFPMIWLGSWPVASSSWCRRPS